MGYINIFISKSAKVSVKNNQLFVESSERKEDYPLEDINSVMIESKESIISTYALSSFAEFGILAFVCDNVHLPSGVILPFCGHFHTKTIFDKQNEIGKPFQKQLWQSIVKNKIKNQNEVLNFCGETDVLKHFVAEVLSGDSGNAESKASLVYFKKLFGKNFGRRVENTTNAFLNYGYSIIRGFVARSVVVHGFMPFMGLNHHNQYNSFNLADDLMEVFRPIVDLYVKFNVTEESELNSKEKAKLYNLVNYDILVDGEKQAVGYAIDLFVQSYQKSLEKAENKLKNIEITRLEMHEYE